MMIRRAFLRILGAFAGLLAVSAAPSPSWGQLPWEYSPISGREVETSIRRVIDEAKAVARKHKIDLTPEELEALERETRSVIWATVAEYYFVVDP